MLHLVQFHRPQGPNLDGLSGQHIAAVEAAKGLEALPHMAEIWPLGGVFSSSISSFAGASKSEESQILGSPSPYSHDCAGRLA